MDRELGDERAGTAAGTTGTGPAAAAPFVSCGSCRTAWATWDDFVVDGRVRFLGLQAMLRVPDTNLLVFEHGCGSSVSVLTSRLQHLLPPVEHPEWPSLRGTEECAGHCLTPADLMQCERECSNARDRELIRIVLQVRRDSASPAGP
jgi:hypothetical protein